MYIFWKLNDTKKKKNDTGENKCKNIGNILKDNSFESGLINLVCIAGEKLRVGEIWFFFFFFYSFYFDLHILVQEVRACVLLLVPFPVFYQLPDPNRNYGRVGKYAILENDILLCYSKCIIYLSKHINTMFFTIFY